MGLGLATEGLVQQGFPFSRELHQILSINNGQDESFYDGCIGFNFLPLPPFPDTQLIDMEDQFSIIFSLPKDYVKKLYFKRNWIQFGSEDAGGSICIDTDPDVKGKVGQIISFNKDDGGRVVFADSLAEFILALTRKLENDEFTVTNDPPMYYNLRFSRTDFDNVDWEKYGGYNTAIRLLGEVDADNDLLGKRKK